MNNLFKLSLGIVVICCLSACSSEREDTSVSIDEQVKVVEDKSAINPPVLPSVSENPAIELNH